MKLPTWVRWMLKLALKWLIKHALSKLEEGIWIKIELKEDVLHIRVKLEDNPPRMCDCIML